jgi:hypothetical protein
LEATTSLGAGPTNVNTSVTLPTATPLVRALRRAHTLPDAALHATELDDVHTVPSDSLPPTRPQPEYRHSPTPDPSNVTLAAPVTPPLLASALLASGPSNVHASVTVPAADDPVTITARTVRVPRDSFALTLESDTHNVISDPLAPTPTTALLSSGPIPDPRRVTLEAPVAAPFVITTLLAEGPDDGYENASDKLPNETAAVPTSDRCPDTPNPVFTQRALSDVHAVASDCDPPFRNSPLDVVPAFDPSSVTLIAPVDAAFATDMLLPSAPTYVNDPDTVPTASPAVKPTARTIPTPPPTLLTTELDDVHSVASDAEALSRSDSL